jgi:cytochrome oxidase Cu insertion factor (SCO1/SenC/PrrC family)
MGKKPAILTLIYFRCQGKCSPFLNNLADMLAALKVDPKNYVILTVSIDPAENPELAKEKKENYFNTFEKPFPEETWRFLTAVDFGTDSPIYKLLTIKFAGEKPWHTLYVFLSCRENASHAGMNTLEEERQE